MGTTKYLEEEMFDKGCVKITFYLDSERIGDVFTHVIPRIDEKLLMKSRMYKVQNVFHIIQEDTPHHVDIILKAI